MLLNAVRILKRTSCAWLTLSLCAGSAVHAGEGGFVGVYGGVSDSLDTGRSSASYKFLTGAHITDRLALEFAYMDLGTTRYDKPTSINTTSANGNPIDFDDAGHGEVSIGAPGDGTPVAVPVGEPARTEFNGKSPSTFTGVQRFRPEGGVVALRYRFPLSDDFSFFLKTGFFAWVANYNQISLTATQTNPNPTAEITANGTASGVTTISGGGFIYRPASFFSMRAELESTAINSEDMPRTRFQNLSLGMNWEF